MHNPNIIICDTSCLIILNNIGELELLYHLYGKIITTSEIAKEYGEALPDWISVVNVQDNAKEQILQLQLDKGEASAIALAMEIPNSLLILDDLKARKIAIQLQLKFTGTIGVIIKSKLQGIIPSIRPIISKIKVSNFRLSSEIEQEALKIAKE